jgi:acyl-CoA hydrolase
MANAEPVPVMDALEAAADRLRGVRAHQMLPLRERPSMAGGSPGLRHVSWFLSPHDRPHFLTGGCDLVPNAFSQVPRLLVERTRHSLVLAACAPPDARGWFPLGLHADYLAPLVGRVPFVLAVNHAMPPTCGPNRVHARHVAMWCEDEWPLVELGSRAPRHEDEAIARLVAERIPDGATLQAGIGAIPDLVTSLLRDHRDLGIHSELLSDGMVDLIERGVATGARKRAHRHVAVATNAIGGARLYDFVRDNRGIELWGVDHTNDPAVIAGEPGFVAVNAALEVDFLGQCASESIGSRYRSSSGGQPDFARGAALAEGGRSFVVVPSRTRDGEVSRIVPRLRAGAAVTTPKNLVDTVVTEHGVADLRGATIRERTRRMIAIAHPDRRDGLTAAARAMGFLA